MPSETRPIPAAGESRRTLVDAAVRRYRRVRSWTEHLCDPLETEDYVIQSMPDVSPAKWHLAHTTWFFEVFLLEKFEKDHRPFHAAYAHLFNSYYNTLGAQWSRPDRGILSRPTVREVFDYRRRTDERMIDLLESAADDDLARMLPLVEVGVNHEQQHQELMLTDLKHVFSRNPLNPVYRETPDAAAVEAAPLRWIEFEGGLRSIGHEGGRFAYDNETPRHRAFLEPFAIASRPVTNGEFLAFVEEGGYDRPEHWLSDGWAAVKSEGWDAPLYWRRREGGPSIFTLGGERPLDPAEPVVHVGFFEADAYARWAGARLPTEEEWEVAAEGIPVEGNFAESRRCHPAPVADAGGSPAGMFGDVWEWTGSPYRPYPGYRAPDGALGEYNAKFMVNQVVLRGGSCATPGDHVRATYRNFFPPHARWQFMGFRLAREV